MAGLQRADAVCQCKASFAHAYGGRPTGGLGNYGTVLRGGDALCEGEPGRPGLGLRVKEEGGKPPRPHHRARSSGKGRETGEEKENDRGQQSAQRSGASTAWVTIVLLYCSNVRRALPTPSQGVCEPSRASTSPKGNPFVQNLQPSIRIPTACGRSAFAGDIGVPLLIGISAAGKRRRLACFSDAATPVGDRPAFCAPAPPKHRRASLYHLRAAREEEGLKLRSVTTRYHLSYRGRLPRTPAFFSFFSTNPPLCLT